MSKFIHALVIARTEYDETDIDDYGQPTAAAPSATDVMGLVQPRRVDEMAGDYRSAGTEIGDHVIFLPKDADIRHADAIIFGTERYEVVGVRRFRYGRLAHIEVDARLVTATPALPVGS